MPRANAILALLATILCGGMGGVAFAADNLSVSVSLTIGSAGSPAIQVQPSTSAGAPLLTSEAGGVALAVVSLNQAPSGTVSITVGNPAPGEVSLSASTLVFTPGDWAPRVLVISGVDDGIADGDQAVTLSFSAASGGSQFDGLVAAPLHVLNLDDEVPVLLISESGGGTIIGENGLGDSIDISLAAQPSGTVTVSLSADPQVQTSVASLSFDASDWNQPKTVTLSAVDDLLPNGTRSLPLGASAAGGGYDGATAAVTVTILDNDAAGLLASPASVITTEAGSTVMVQVGLTSRPQSAVTLSASSLDLGEATVSPASVTILPAAWQTPATFTIQGVDDILADGNQPFVISVLASGDSAFAGQTAGIAGVNIDDDQKTILISQVSGLDIAEGGSPATYRVRLAQPPTASVTVAIAGDAAVGANPASLVFTTGNWNQQQTVSVGAVDDQIAQGQHSGVLTHTWTSADAGYQSVTGLTLAFSIADNDSANIAYTLIGPAFTTEVGGSTSFSVRLGSRPLATVTVPVISSDPGQGTASPSSLIFDASTWNLAQVVTVTGMDANNRDDGNVSYAVSLGPAASTDPAYAGRVGGPVALVNRAIDHAPAIDPLVDRSVAEDSGQLLVPLTGISNGQAGETQAVTVTATTSNSLVSGTPGIAYANPSTTGTLSLIPPPDANGSATITVRVSDGVQTTSRSFTFTVTPVNDPPSLQRSTQLITAWHGNGIIRGLLASASAPGQLACTDLETPAPQLALLVVVAPGLGRLERVDLATGNAASLIAGDTFTQAEIDAGRMRYVHSSNAPTLLDALQFQIQDGNGGSTAGVLSIRIDASLPSIDLLPSAASTWTEGDTALTVAALAAITDLDSPSFAGGSLTVGTASGGEAGDVLAISHEGDAAGQVGFDAGTGALRYGGAVIGSVSGGTGSDLLIAWSNAGATPAAAQAVLRRVTWASTSQAPSATDRILEAQAVDDLGNVGPVALHTIHVVPVNDPPVVADLALVTVAGQAVPGQILASDPDSPTLSYSLASQPGRGSATIDAATGAISYQAAAGASGSDSFQVSVGDGSLSTSATVTVRISGPGSSGRLWITSDPPLEVQENDVLAFNVVADDGDIPGGAADLRFRLLDAPAGMVLIPDAPNHQAAVTWTAVPGADRHLRFRVLAWDETSGAADLMQVVLHVHPAPGGSN